MQQDKPGEGQILLIDFDRGEHGHRGQYNEMLARLFNLRQARFGLSAVLSRKPVLVPLIEHSPGLFFLACLVRGLLGRRTVGLLFRPLPTLHGPSLAMRIKRLMCRLLLRVPGTTVLTIVPFAVEPGFSGIAHGWIYDLQNWDLQLEAAPGFAAGGQLADRIRAAAGQRAVCCAIGGQGNAKGFDRFARIFSANPELRAQMLFVFGGKVAAENARDAAAFADAGGLGFDRFVSDQELLDLYAAADLVWCVYDPDYDQASGIMGRAMQLGIPVVARSGSLIERLCMLAGHPNVTIGADGDWPALLAVPPRLPPAAAQQRARDEGAASLARLAEALGVAPAYDPFQESRLA